MQPTSLPPPPSRPATGPDSRSAGLLRSGRFPLVLLLSLVFWRPAPAQDCGTSLVWRPPLTDIVYYPAVSIRHEAVYLHHPAVTVTHPAVVVSHPAVVVHHPAQIVHHEAVVVHHPAVTQTEYDEFGNPYEVEISPAWDEEIAPAWDEEVAAAWDEEVSPAWDEVLSPEWVEEITPAWDELITAEWDEVIEPQREEIVIVQEGWWEEVDNPCSWSTAEHTYGEWSPDPASVTQGQTFTQSRTVTTVTRNFHRNEAGVVSETGSSLSTSSEERTATGTATGGGSGGSGGSSGGSGSGGSQTSLVSPPPPGSTRSVWRDVNGDGIPDEIISAHDPRVGLVLTVEQGGWEDDFSGAWELETLRDGDRVFTGFTWSFENLIVPPSNDPWAQFDVIFAPEPGYEYIVWSDDDYGYGNNMALWPAAVLNGQPRHTSADIAPGSATLTVPSPRTFLSALTRTSWYLIRLGTWSSISASNPDTWPAPFQKLLTGDADFDDTTLDGIADPLFDGAQPIGSSITRDQAYRFLIAAASDRIAMGEAVAIPAAIPLAEAIAAAIKATQIGAALGTAVAVLTEVHNRRQDEPFSYVVYEMKNTITNRFYIGRSARYGDHTTVLNKRIAEHAWNGRSAASGWTTSRANAWITTRGKDVGARYAMRGREQSVLDVHQSTGNIVDNSIRAVALINPASESYYNTSNSVFGVIHAYTGWPMPLKHPAAITRPLIGLASHATILP